MSKPVASPFTSLGLDARLVSALVALGYEEPTPIQSAAIPPLIEGRDVFAQAATGTGKTAAFALPILHRNGGGERGVAPSALILVPTRSSRCSSPRPCTGTAGRWASGCFPSTGARRWRRSSGR